MLIQKSRILVLALLILLNILLGINGFINSPKIITKDGNLIFESGLNRNISFRLQGNSRININDEYDILDLLLLSTKGRNASTTDGWQILENDEAWRTAASELASLKLRVFGAQGLDKRLRRLQNVTSGSNQQLRRFKTRLQTVENKVQRMVEQLELDNCRSNPCENGGACFNMFKGFACKCTKNFEGPTCDKDVNECALFAGTDLGCQNGGQCVNQFGGYSCICAPGWFGMHCTQRKGDCLQSSAWELCGHGTCVSNNDNFGYKCICDQGWKTNGLTPSCSVDVDECSESHPPCATRCINLQGSFTCAPCAAGLTGSGISCHDVDECATNNGGCSLSPRVACINSYGSYHCGECPLGWSGNGHICERNTNTNDIATTSCAGVNICHPDATCSEISNTVVCTCPLGMIGSGIGVNGCVIGSSINCNSSPCLNGGTCVDRDDSYFCLCRRGYRSPNCTPVPSPCTPNPCLNNGRCRPGGGTDYTCQCPPGFSGRLCDNRSVSRCGGVLAGAVGRLKYPEGDTYEHSSQCAWVIRTNETLVLNVTFSAFDLEDSTACRFDWLQINDGRTAASQIVGRFCGARKPMGGNIISSTEFLYLWFRSDNSTARAGFELSWNSIEPVCGGLIELETHGTIATPGSPGNYPKNRDCRWHLRASNSKRIKLTFFSLAIESHDSCNYDYVEITDVLSGVVLDKYCNSTHPAPLMLPTNEAIIHFHSDNEGTDNGFQIHYSTEARVPGCGGTYTAKEATIRSPEDITESISCEYDIKMAVGESIRIEFTKFEMGDEDCVELYDVQPSKQIFALQSKYCGRTQPVLFSSLFNALQIRFYSVGGTFELKYVADCSYTYESASDVITSPNYPHLNNMERLCTYKIVTEPNTVISLNLVDFDIQDSSLEEDNDCAYSNLMINDGLDRSIMGPYCGNNTPPRDIVSKTNLVILYLKSGATSSGKGFKLEYRAIPVGKTDCGGVYTKPGLSIRLPTGDDGSYLHDMECYWVIMAPPNRGILLNWKSFNLEPSTDCTYDYLEIYDNLANTENDKPLGRYCDERPPPALLSHSRILTIKFVSDFSDAFDGFELSYEFVDYMKNCGGEIISSSGQINSPEWPLNYTNSKDCIWTITTPENTQMELQVETFELEEATKCTNDWLEIRNGGSVNSSLVGFYCGKNIPHVIPSFTNQMRLHFHTDAFVNGRGFLIKWYVYSNGCGGNLNTDLGVITSPFYPNTYPHNAQCEWRVHVNKGSSIHFTIEDLDMEDLSHCAYDSIDIFDGRTSSESVLAKICSLPDDKPAQYVTSGNEALVRFNTDSSNAQRGFLMSYYTNCTRTLTDLHGAIESSNYGNSYHRTNVNCTWTIKSPKGNHLFLEFTHFDSMQGGEVYLSDITMNGTAVHHSLHGIAMFNSTGDTVRVVHNNSAVSFRLEYTVTGCVGVFHSDNGSFESPNYPKMYPNDVECIWEILTIPGQGIELTVNGMDIEESVNCTKDGLQISNSIHAANHKEKHCGKQIQLTYTSSGHRMFVRFYSDGTTNGKGFQATYRTLKSPCGGILQSKNGVIQSPNYPLNYPPNSDCEWFIYATDHHRIKFTLEELDLEGYYECDYDYVEAYEYKSGEEGKQIFKTCGQLDANTSEWTTTSNVAVVRFKSDDSNEDKGFKLSFKELCGERHVFDDTEISYLEISHNSQMDNQTCEWQLITTNVTKQIMFVTTHVQLNPALSTIYATEGDCLEHGVKIFSGEDDKGPLLTKFCRSHPEAVFSHGHSMMVQVPLGVIHEFEGYYTTMDTYCGGYFDSTSGRFASPYYPSSYPVNIDCVWNIQASAGNAIALTIESMDLEQSDDCNEDYLEVREDDESGNLLGIFCGTTVPPQIRGSSSLWLKFRSGNDNVGDGFLASYNYVMHNELNGTEGKIQSPRYPTKFVSNEPYSWRITVDRDYVVLLTFEHIIDVDVPFIKFYDGYSDIGAPIDYTDKHLVRSNTNILYFTATRGPFEFEWRQLSKDAIRSNRTAEEMTQQCGNGVLNVNQVLFFSSPGYPNGYASNLHCSWTIVPQNPATHAVLQFTKIDLEEFSGCIADYVRISTSSDMQHWQELDSLCKKPNNTIKTYDGTPYLKLDFVTDAGVNKTGFSTYTKSVCGSELTGRSGFVNITNLSGGIHMFQMNCTWTIRARQGRRIRIKFLDSYLHDPSETTNTCRTFFLVRNGIDGDSPFLQNGKYCDNDISDVLETTSNRAFIKFTRIGFPKFKASFHYEEIDNECSEEIILSEETLLDRTRTISTPKYPNIPNPHSECIWKIVAPPHHVISLDFIGNFDLATGTAPVITACDREYVQINDGTTELMPLLGKYCGTTKPDTKYSTSNVLRIKYFTDISEPHIGFMANVSIGRCGGSYYTNEGVLNSPVEFMLRGNEKEFECVYIIQMEQGSTINLTMDTVELPTAYNCSDVTHLELQEIDMYGSQEENITDVLRICGSNNKRYIVETNKVIIRYKIKGNPSVNDRFKISYNAIGSRCYETIIAPQGILQTPGYPMGVRKPTHCVWNIRVPKGRKVKIEFLDFDTGSTGNGSNTAADMPRRFRGRIIFANDPLMESIIGRVAYNPPDVLYSTDNTMTINTFLLAFGTHRGFKLRFSSDEPSRCAWSNLENRNMSTYSFIRNNETSMYCSYYIRVRGNRTVALHVDKFEDTSARDFISGGTCQFLSPLKLELNGKKLLPELMCKNETQRVVRLPFNVALKLSGNAVNHLRQMDLSYKVYECGGIRSIMSGEDLTIRQPQMNNHSGMLECAWAVWPEGMDSENSEYMDELMTGIQLEFELTTDFKGTCEEQYLLVYNGPDQNSPHLGRYCNQASANNLVVEGGLFVEYVTTIYETQSSFNLTVKEGSGCGGIIKYPYRQIVFDKQYINNAECIWDIVADPGFYLSVSFLGRFYIESSTDCKKDYLKVQQKDKNGDWEDLQTLCGREPPKYVNTTNTEMRLIFRSDGNTTGDGFTAQFDRNCGGIFYATNEVQQISTPGYPNQYENNLVCNYTIEMPKNSSKKGLLVRFLDFDIEDSPINKCIFDNVTIYMKEGYIDSETVICGKSERREFRSNDRISVVLRTDMSFRGKGFQMEFGTNQCGGIITNATKIKTPQQQTDRSFPSNSNCFWNLTAPPDYKILIKFEELDFEGQLECAYDSVDIYKGLVPVLDQRLAKLCGNLTGHLPMLTISSNTGLIHSFTDDSTPSRGFSALINFIPNCDKNIYLGVDNSTYSFNAYSGTYADNLDCAYVFTTLPGHQLQIEFSSFHVEESDTCNSDYLELRDGAGPFGDVIGIFCGHTIPPTLMSSKNVLFARFVSDAVVTSTGFEAKVKSLPMTCGDHNVQINGTGTITLSSPDSSNGNYPSNLNCFWRIKSDNNIHLQFEKFDVQGANANGSCAYDSLKIYSGEDADKIEKGYGHTVIFNGFDKSSDWFNIATEHIYCGSIVPDDYFANSKEIYVKFKTDSSIEKAGFKFKATGGVGCYRNYTGTQGRILIQETADHCDIYIKAPQNYSLSIYYDDTSFSEIDCTKEYIEVFETKTNTSLRRDCQYISAGQSLFTTHNELRMRIQMSSIFSSFDITYLASDKGPGCGGDLYNTRGVISSPFYPTHVRENSDCRWNIRVPSNLHVLLKFEAFNMGAKTTCHSDYLEIIEHTADGQEIIMRSFCGEDNPKVYKSEKSYLTVRFHKTVNYDGTGWVLKFSGVYANYKIPDFFLTD